MAASSVQNPPTLTESKSAKKKKAKAADRTESPAPTASPAPEKAGDAADDGESPYIRELQKNIRNVNKKLTNASKTDSLIAEHPGKSLDDLVSLKIINADQKVQVLKKPGLQNQLNQLEEQITQYKKIDHEYKSRAAADKAAAEKAFAEKLEKEKADAANEVKEKLDAEYKTALHSNLLLVSQFLRLAAARRSEDADQTVDENRALEGVLLAIYTGDETAVTTMLKLVEASDEKTYSVNGEQLHTTYAQVKTASQSYLTPLYETEAAASTDDTSAVEPATDPTIAHASLSEIRAGDDVALTNGHPAEQTVNSTANADVTSSAANAAAENRWDSTNDLSESQEWVSVPRDPTETETGLDATPAVPATTQSWADDQPEVPVEVPVAADPNDGFSQVQGRNNRGRGERESGWRGGRGRGEGWRGRGYRGDGRGRGRGGPRGGPSQRGERGARRTEES